MEAVYFGRENVMPEPLRSFSSALSVNQHLRGHACGLEPLCIVSGSSIYHIGWQAPAWSRAAELEVLTRSLAEARRLAIGRLTASAERLGADGVAGIQFETRPDRWGRRLTEFIATGTAIKHRLGSAAKTPGGALFTSNLNASDLWLLLQAGYQPVSMPMGVCVYHARYQGVGRWLGQIGQNLEMPTFTQALSEARSLALGRMEDQARQSGASGILGVDLTEHSHAWGSHVIECFALGSALLAPDTPHAMGEPLFILSLSDPPPPEPPTPVVEIPVPGAAESVEVSVDIG